MARRFQVSVEALEAKTLLSSLAYSVTTDRSAYATGQPVQMTFTETNIGSQPVNVTWGPSDDAFDIVHDGVTVWSSTEGLIPAFLVEQTLAPGQSFTHTATWNGQQNEGTPVGPTGTYTITNQLAASGASATVTIGVGTANSTDLLPLTTNANPFGGATTVQAAEVNSLYDTILGRSPDPAGLAADLRALQAGTPVSQLASNLLHSTEYDSDVVAADYRTILGRPGSPSEIAGWVARMQAGETAGQVAAGFLTSPEYTELQPANGNFIEAVYEDATGSPATAREMSAALGQLSGGMSRAELVSGIMGATTVQEAAIDDLYLAILGRPSDSAGLGVGLSGLQSGALSLTDIAADLLGSAEYASRAKGSVG